MSGSLRRLGVIVPGANVVVEEEFPPLLPAGVQMHIARMFRRSRQVNYDSLSEMVQSAEPVALGLGSTVPEVILFACTSASFKDGLGEDRKLAARISAAAGGVPTVCTSTALVEALQQVGARRVLLVTPYVEDLNRREESFFAEAGFTVTRTASFLLGDTIAIRDLPSAEVARLVLANSDAAAASDAVFISCTNMHSMDQLVALEQALGKPVLSSNQCTLWAGLKAMGLAAARRPAGRLLDSLAMARAAAE